jgi:hypothetical protein
MYRVRFDRNLYSVPPTLVSQPVVVRANDEYVRVFLGIKEVARHRRCWDVGQDIEEQTHREAALEMKPGAKREALPPALRDLRESGITYFKVLAAGTKSLQRETLRLVFLSELFGITATRAAIDDVMQTGHVGAEYVEYVLRHKKGLTPSAAPLRLGDPVLDALSLRDPDLSRYGELVPAPMSCDPGEPPIPDEESDETR